MTPPPINAVPLFPVLDTMLIELLKSLTAEEWQSQTVARLWKVKDVAAHLLDGNLRGLSIARDQHVGESPGEITSYQQLIDFLNELNRSWTAAAKRLSPAVLISLLESTGHEYSEYLSSLDPYGPAVFPVAWAGESTSLNWFHIAREYTEKFLHQQQIRDATNRPGLMTKELFHPFINTLMYALPHTYRDVKSPEGTTVSVIISSEAGGKWTIISTGNGWQSIRHVENETATLTITPELAWKLFSKSLSPELVRNDVQLAGDKHLAMRALNMVSVMA